MWIFIVFTIVSQVAHAGAWWVSADVVGIMNVKSGVGCEYEANTYKLNRQDESTHGASTHESRNGSWGLLNNGSVHQWVNQTIIVSINHTMGASISEWLAGLLTHRLKEWRVVSLNQSLIRCNSTTHLLKEWTFDTVSHYLIIWPTDLFLILK